MLASAAMSKLAVSTTVSAFNKSHVVIFPKERVSVKLI